MAGSAGEAAQVMCLPLAEGVVHLRGAVSVEECRRWTEGVYAARAAWTPCFEGVQFTLGRAYYTHLEEELAGEYFASSAASDAVVERALPGLQSGVRAMLAGLVGAPVSARPGWCGPGVHIFPAGEWLSRNGGDVHFDTEGLVGSGRASLTALSAILMLQPPEHGGGLRVWDAVWTGADDQAAIAAAARAPSRVVQYACGDLVVIDSHRLHQIQPFSGARDRISITAHLLHSPSGWQSWF